MAGEEANAAKPRQQKEYDYLLKFLLVGDSDVGKQEILSGLEDGASESPFCSGSGEKHTRFFYFLFLSCFPTILFRSCIQFSIFHYLSRVL